MVKIFCGRDFKAFSLGGQRLVFDPLCVKCDVTRVFDSDRKHCVAIEFIVVEPSGKEVAIAHGLGREYLVPLNKMIYVLCGVAFVGDKVQCENLRRVTGDFSAQSGVGVCADNLSPDRTVNAILLVVVKFCGNRSVCKVATICANSSINVGAVGCIIRVLYRNLGFYCRPYDEPTNDMAVRFIKKNVGVDNVKRLRLVNAPASYGVQHADSLGRGSEVV